MRRARHCLALGSWGVVLIVAAHADVDPTGGPAQHVFLARNPFGLKPAPTNVVAPPAPVAPPVQVDYKLAGITSDSAGKRAWIVIPVSPARPGVPAVTNSTHFAIAEGERQGDIEVLEIDPKENTVRILSAGQEVTLDFESNGLAAPPMAIPGRAGVPRVIPGSRLPAAAVPPPAIPAVRSSTLNQSSRVTPASGAVGSSRFGTAIPATASANSMIAGGSLPTRDVRTTPEAPGEIDAATQAILMRAQEARQRSLGRPFPPLPPMPGMPPAQ